MFSCEPQKVFENIYRTPPGGCFFVLYLFLKFWLEKLSHDSPVFQKQQLQTQSLNRSAVGIAISILLPKNDKTPASHRQRGALGTRFSSVSDHPALVDIFRKFYETARASSFRQISFRAAMFKPRKLNYHALEVRLFRLIARKLFCDINSKHICDVFYDENMCGPIITRKM